MNNLLLYFTLFMVYSVIGWLMEVTLSIITEKKFVNRGFLIGPYCPIYGWGCILILILLKDQNNDYYGTFLKSIAICSVLEYSTSYFMEKIFHAHWWDYSDMRFNINGRICLETMIPFGIIASIVYYIINPFFVNVISKINPVILLVINIIALIIFIIDNIISFNVILKIRTTIKTIKTDNTEEINKLIKKVLNSTKLTRRIKEAFPDFKAKIKYIEDKIKTITK